MSAPNLSRREFLKLCGAGIASLALGTRALPTRAQEVALNYGRCLLKYVTIYKQPSVFAAQNGIHLVESVIPLMEEVPTIDEGFSRNPRWYRTVGGYVHSSNVQPVEWRLNPPQFRFTSDGTLAEVTVPFVDSRKKPSDKFPFERLYYGSTHWVKAALRTGKSRTIWYELWDWRTKETSYVPSQTLHVLTTAELAPISPNAQNKRLLVNIQDQTMHAFEGDQLVREMRMSSGRDYTESGGGNYGTPTGKTNIYLKRPSQHMTGGDLAAGDDYDLPGVPWVSFFNGGMAIHGTYWHNDYGTPWSHGCLNVNNADAKWVYLWSSPVVPLGAQEVENADGTLVEVV